MREQSLLHLKVSSRYSYTCFLSFFEKHRGIKIDDEIEQLRQQSFITSKTYFQSFKFTFDLIDYEEPIIHTPFYVDAHITSMITKDQQNTKGYDRRRNHSAVDEEEK